MGGESPSLSSCWLKAWDGDEQEPEGHYSDLLHLWTISLGLHLWIISVNQLVSVINLFLGLINPVI
jgi:hypothetical protein